jgi:putative lipoic acid-binding regulatory protein
MKEDIIITEEALLRVGFRKSVFHPLFFEIEVNTCTLNYYIKDGRVTVSDYGDYHEVTIMNDVTHFHVIQNIYHLLSGKELL